MFFLISIWVKVFPKLLDMEINEIQYGWKSVNSFNALWSHWLGIGHCKINEHWLSALTLFSLVVLHIEYNEWWDLWKNRHWNNHWSDQKQNNLQCIKSLMFNQLYIHCLYDDVMCQIFGHCSIISNVKFDILCCFEIR